MKFLTRSVVVSVLDPVPENFRVGPNVVVLNPREIRAMRGGDHAVSDAISEAINAYDRERLRRLLEDAGK